VKGHKKEDFVSHLPENKRHILFLLPDRENQSEAPQELSNYDIIDLADHQNYYFTFFEILKRLYFPLIWKR